MRNVAFNLNNLVTLMESDYVGFHCVFVFDTQISVAKFQMPDDALDL
jgi:hypothetical protein